MDSLAGLKSILPPYILLPCICRKYDRISLNLISLSERLNRIFCTIRVEIVGRSEDLVVCDGAVLYALFVQAKLFLLSLLLRSVVGSVRRRADRALRRKDLVASPLFALDAANSLVYSAEGEASSPVASAAPAPQQQRQRVLLPLAVVLFVYRNEVDDVVVVVVVFVVRK